MSLDPTILEAFRRLHAQALASDDPEPNAMTVATAGADGRVHARMVLLKTADERGFTFFTRYDSDKGVQLEANPRIALCLLWKRLKPAAQVRIEGRAEKLPAAESDAYFATRERLSQLGAWASLQSRTLPERVALERRVDEFDHRFAGEHRWNERERWELIDGTWRKRLLYP